MSHWIGTTSPTDAGMNDFKECLKHLRDGHPEEALLHARRALGAAPKNPFYLSYTGLLAASPRIATATRNPLPGSAGDAAQSRAALFESGGGLSTGGRTQEAIDTLEKGLVSAGRDFRIRRALERIGTRREPVLTFLHRSHPLNRTLGKWRHRMTGPSQAA